MVNNIPVKYVQKSLGRAFVDSLGFTYFNLMLHEIKNKYPSSSK